MIHEHSYEMPVDAYTCTYVLVSKHLYAHLLVNWTKQRGRAIPGQNNYFSVSRASSFVIMLICIGGVCVPYTAVVPIILLALKWVVVKLVRMGLLPKAIGDILQVSNTTTSDTGEELMTAHGPSVVTKLVSEELFRELIRDGKEKIVCKFTARYEPTPWETNGVPLLSQRSLTFFSLSLS